MKKSKRGIRIFRFFLLVLSLCLLLINLANSSISFIGKIDSKVYKELEQNDKIRVIIKTNLSDEKISENLDVDMEKIREYKDMISIDVSEQKLKEIEKNPAIEGVFYSHKIKAFLQDSINLINASQVWDIQISGINITGIDETICVLDTGINFSHPDLVGKNKTNCLIDCFYRNCTENCSRIDDAGHGTHVAGIIGANKGINGTAPGVNFIGLKVLDENGDGSPSAELDVTDAIDWCVNNQNLYNISVISMSFGTNSPYLYNNHCDAVFSNTWATSINNAILHNISVIVSSGNSYNYTHISSPACIANATSVGASTKNDFIPTYSNRNSITDLFAPGGNSTSQINSTSVNGGYMTMYGTSMAAPHVAGAFALIHHFFKLNEQKIITPVEIQALLNSTGKQIYDSTTGLTFPRIDIYSAINYSGSEANDTEINVIFSLSNNTHTNQNQTNFTCNSTSNSELKNISFYIWNSTNLIYNAIENISGTFNSTNFNYAFLTEDIYLWNCIAYNNQSSFNLNENYSLVYDATKPNITLISPEDSVSYVSISQTINFQHNVSEKYSDYCSLIINNITNITNFDVNESLMQNFTQIFPEGNYYWKIKCADYAGNEADSVQRNFSITSPPTQQHNVNEGSAGNSGGGGGSITSSEVYLVSNEEILKPYNKQIKINDKIKFNIRDIEHVLTAKEIKKDSIAIEIKSEPINLILKIGESKKLNLSSTEEDFFIKLNNILNQKADITIQYIKSPVEISDNQEGISDKKTTITGKSVMFDENITNKAKISTIFLILIIFLIALFFKKKRTNKKIEDTKKEYSERFKSLVSNKKRKFL